MIINFKGLTMAELEGEMEKSEGYLTALYMEFDRRKMANVEVRERLNKLGETLKAVRLSAGLGQSELVDKMAEKGVAVSQGTISNWEHCYNIPSKKARMALSNVLGTEF